MAKAPVIDTCRICGFHGPMSREHIPPAKAFNEQRVTLEALQSWLQRDDLSTVRGKHQQGGMRRHTLCVPCNTTTGGWYAKDYVTWAHTGVKILQFLAEHDESKDVVSILVEECRPLRFLKQCVVMVFSVNGPDFRLEHPQLTEFVRDPERQHLPPGYDVYLTLTRGPRIRYGGLSARIRDGRDELSTEVAFPPFAVELLIESPRPNRVGCITHFGDCGFNEIVDAEMVVSVGEVHTPLPGDYRTLEQIQEHRRRNQEPDNWEPPASKEEARERLQEFTGMLDKLRGRMTK